MKYIVEDRDRPMQVESIEVPGPTDTRLRIVDLKAESELGYVYRGLEISQKNDFTGRSVWEPVDLNYHSEQTIKQLANFIVTLLGDREDNEENHEEDDQVKDEDDDLPF